MSWTYNGYEGNDYQETPWYDREKALFQAIIDALPDAGETYVDSQHYHSKLVSPDGTVDPVLCVTDDGFLGVGTSTPGYLVHVWVGDGGPAAGAAVGAENLIMESDGDAGISVLLGSGGTATLYTGDADDLDGKITWNDNQWKFYSDAVGGVYNALMSTTYSGYFNPGTIDLDFIVAADTTVAIKVDGETGDITFNVALLSGSYGDLRVNWDDGVGLFVQGSDGVVGVGTATLQTWKTATYESVLSFGSAGKCAIAGDGSTLDIVSDAYYDVTNSRWEHGTAATGSARIALSDGVYMYIPDGTGNPGDPLTWLEIFEAKYTGAAAGLVHINALKAGAFYLKVSQKSTAAQPCVYLEQDDASEGYIDFIGTMCAVCNTSSVGSLRMEVNGTVYRFQVFPDTDL